ncbi:hypothetical protein BJ981_000288 [Sphaerisporangium krabiense]|uniref:Uncharacterized protein n=1 Tax=Sphaerisporangium krabiense TaxID=763782 RepID=A0A7W8YZC1_9ACTN|nr:hypothetical protein [Sphaerisporangium krabiense]
MRNAPDVEQEHRMSRHRQAGQANAARGGIGRAQR